MKQYMRANIFNTMNAECGKFMDKHLEGALNRLDAGIKEIQQRYPGI